MHPADIARSVDTWEQMKPLYWRGVPCQQMPSDMMRYAQVLQELQPPWVLELGTADGGCALFLADVVQDWDGQVISIDNDPRPLGITHPRLLLLKRDAASEDTRDDLERLVRPGGWVAFHDYGRGVILLDDDHSGPHVLRELELWADLADYLIVEDGIMEYLPQYGWGPHEALREWLPRHPEFRPDTEPVPTNHPGGWLRRVS